jgi:hypothetical protein
MKIDYRPGLCALLGIFMSIFFSGCSDDGNPGSLRVRVVNEGGQEIADATVVLGNSDGSMITYGTTDATGIVRFQNPPNNATVTAGIHCQAYSRTYYYLAAAYDVNISELTLNVINLTNGFVSWEEFSDGNLVISRIFSSRPYRFNGSLKNVLKRSYQLYNF